VEVEVGDGLLDAYDSSVLGLDDRTDALEVGSEAGENRETALDGGDALMLGLDGRADPLQGRGAGSECPCPSKNVGRWSANLVARRGA
jgi:hypothetical protein